MHSLAFIAQLEGEDGGVVLEDAAVDCVLAVRDDSELQSRRVEMVTAIFLVRQFYLAATHQRCDTTLIGCATPSGPPKAHPVFEGRGWLLGIVE